MKNMVIHILPLKLIKKRQLRTYYVRYLKILLGSIAI
jgi:hypothetical protein